MKYIDAEKLLAALERQNADKNIIQPLIRIIDFLQQEQPDKDKKTFDDYLKASPSERRKMNMTEILGEEKLAETKKQMEQPEVDLEKELDQWKHEHFAGERDGHYSGEYLERSSQLDLARHFYELGRNQVLQELYKGKIKPFDKIAAVWLDDEQNT